MIAAIPVTPACIVRSAQEMNIPVPVLGGILSVEGGWVGLKKPNENGSYDFGPMQINSLWLEPLAKYGITSHMLRYNGCLNVYVGAWILATIRAEGHTLQRAIGYYHSRRRYAAYTYRVKVISAIQEISDGARLLRRANQLFATGGGGK